MKKLLFMLPILAVLGFSAPTFAARGNVECLNNQEIRINRTIGFVLSRCGFPNNVVVSGGDLVFVYNIQNNWRMRVRFDFSLYSFKDYWDNFNGYLF